MNEEALVQELYRLEEGLIGAAETENGAEAAEGLRRYAVLLQAYDSSALPYARLLAGHLLIKLQLRLAPHFQHRQPPELTASLAEIQSAADAASIGRTVAKLFRTYAESLHEERLNKPSKQVRTVLETIEARYGEELTIQSLAEDAYLSPNHLSFLFKKELGTTINEAITKVRIEQGKKLLQTTTLTVQQIAETVGYKDTNYFAKLFKKMTGQTPKEYRDKW